MKNYDAYNNNEYGKQPIDSYLEDKGIPYGMPFQRAETYFRDIIKSFQSAVGWKSKVTDYDFEGICSYYPAISVDKKTGVKELRIMSGYEVVGRFFPTPDNRLGFEARNPDVEFFRTYGDEPNPWYLLSDLMNGKLFMDQQNLDAVRRETHNGMQVIYGNRFGVECALSANPDDIELVSQITDRFPDGIRFCSEGDLIVSFARFMEEYRGNSGFEPEHIPEEFLLLYDGQTLYDEKEMCVALGKPEVMLDNAHLHASRVRFDYDIIAFMRDEIAGIRDDFERKCGIPKGRHFKFENAVYPMFLREDCVMFVSDRSKKLLNVYTVKDGDVYGVDWDMADAPHLRSTGLSVSEFIEKCRDRLLSEENVELGTEEYRSWSQKEVMRRTLKAFENSEKKNKKDNGHHI